MEAGGVEVVDDEGDVDVRLQGNLQQFRSDPVEVSVKQDKASCVCLLLAFRRRNKYWEQQNPA